MKNMNKNNIRSLDSLIKRKRYIRRQTKKYEEQISDDFFSLAHPFTGFVNTVNNCECEEDIPVTGVYKVALNAKRIVDILRLGFSIYCDVRK